jgi:hypothetical protein
MEGQFSQQLQKIEFEKETTQANDEMTHNYTQRPEHELDKLRECQMMRNMELDCSQEGFKNFSMIIESCWNKHRVINSNLIVNR